MCTLVMAFKASNTSDWASKRCVLGGAHDGLDFLWIRPKVCQSRGGVRDVLGALYAEGPKSAVFWVVRDGRQNGGGGMGGVGGEDLVDVGLLDELDSYRCVDLLCV
jgi:hypothetical protein